VVAPITIVFAAFAIPSAAFATLGLRDFLLRDQPGDREARLRRAGRLQAAGGLVPLLLVVLVALATQGAPVANPRGWAFLGYGVACAALGLGGAWLFHRAAAEPLRRWVKAAETAPMLVVLLDLVLVVNVAAQVPG
jgi:hypothetical protein